jgi:hypothetical protein
MLPLALLLLTPGCGAVMTCGGAAVAIDTEPPGATVVHEGRAVGTTPCVVELHSGAHTFELAMAGHQPRLVDVGLRRNWWLVGNVATLGVGMIVDVALGADRAVNADPVFVHLVPGDRREQSLWLREEPSPRAPGSGGDATGDLAGLGQLVGTALQGIANHYAR